MILCKILLKVDYSDKLGYLLRDGKFLVDQKSREINLVGLTKKLNTVFNYRSCIPKQYELSYSPEAIIKLTKSEKNMLDGIVNSQNRIETFMRSKDFFYA